MINLPSPITQNVQKSLKRRKNKRLVMISIGCIIIAIAASLVFYAMRDTLSFFRTPSEITSEDISGKRPLRLGGFVEKGSVQKQENEIIIFKITDFSKNIEVRFHGILPDLFREGQGIIAEGSFDASHIFNATRVLAKHDETYVPKDIVDRLKAEGLFEATMEGNSERPGQK